ncbi:reverse transcriptase domain-containing protein [Tanacetum coccineum]
MEVLIKREIADQFLDEHLMMLKAKLHDDEPWYADYANYIVGKVVPTKWPAERRKSEILEIIAYCHYGPIGGHHSAFVTGRMVYESRFFWPNIFKVAKDYVMRCGVCQISGNISSRSNKYILVAVDYVSKLVEAEAFPTNDARVVVKFLIGLFARFGVPKALISDMGTHFCNS